MDPTSITIKILEEIRDSVKETNVRIDRLDSSLSGRIDRLDTSLTGRIDQTNSQLEQLAERVVEAEIRTATNVMQLKSTLDEVKTMLHAQHDLRPRVDACEREISRLKHKTGLK